MNFNNMVRRYNNRNSELNGCLYVKRDDAKAMWNDSPKRAASTALAPRTSMTAKAVYPFLIETYLNSGQVAYFLPSEFETN